MNKAPGHRAAQEPKHTLQRRCAGTKQEKQEALQRFMLMKATISKAGSEEVSQVHSFLRARNLLEILGPQLSSVMPEFFCFVNGLSYKRRKTRGIARRLAKIVVSRVLMACKYASKLMREMQLKMQIAKFQLRMGHRDEASQAFKDAASLAAGIKSKDDAGNGAIDFCNRLNGRWNPPYITVLPGAVLTNILSRLSMKEVRWCLSTSKAFRATMLNILHRKETVLSLSHFVAGPLNGPDVLPTELLESVFAHLDMHSLLACRATCSRWRQVAQDNTALWTQEVKLSGSWRQMEMQWNLILELTKGTKPKSLSLKLVHDRNESYESARSFTWKDSELSKSFPHEELRELYYEGEGGFASENQDIWNTLLLCSQLKVLHFSLDEYSCDFKVGSDSNLAKCRLQDFSIDICDCDRSLFYLDHGLLTLLSEAKRISIDVDFSPDDLERLLNTVRGTLAELHLLREPEGVNSFCFKGSDWDEDIDSGEEDDWEYEDDPFEYDFDDWEPLVLRRLTSFTGYLPRPLTLEAPSLRELELMVLRPRDLEVLRTWGRQRLASFRCQLPQLQRSRKPFLNELSSCLVDLPACHSLSLHLGWLYSPYESYDTDVVESFWKSLFAEIERLPRLKHLTITDHDGGMTAQELYTYVRRRRGLGLPIRTLELVVFDHFSVRAARHSIKQYPNSLITPFPGASLDIDHHEP